VETALLIDHTGYQVAPDTVVLRAQLADTLR